MSPPGTQAQSNDPPAPHPLTDRQKMMLFLIMALGQFMALLDTQIVAASLNEIQAGLAASADEISWVQTAYLIAEIIMIPLSGYLSRTFSTRWLFTASAIAFTVASMACGLAWNIESMIVFRAIQGFVGGAMVPTVFATGFALFQGKKQALIPAILGIVSTLAPTLGPTIGGYVTQSLSWHWLFFLNIVPGIVISIAVPIMCRIDLPDLRLLRTIDVIGALLLTVFLGSLEYVLEEGPRQDWFDDPLISGLTLVSVVSGVFFIARALQHANPIVDLHALRSRTFAMACSINFVTGFGIFGTVYMLPLFLARIGGLNSLQIGSAVFVAGVFMVLSTPPTAILSRRMDLRLMTAIGLVMFAVAVYGMSQVSSDWRGEQFFWPQALRGFASMFCIVPATTLALGSLPPSQLKMASALFNTTRNLGGAIGIATINTMLNNRGKSHYAELVESLQRGRLAVDDYMAAMTQFFTPTAGSAAEAQHMALAHLSSLVSREANTLAFADAFRIVALLFALVLLLVPFMGKPRGSVKVSVSDH
ncbi:DHA2 family efflux MFS transporter permease subunit [Andreprevotia chitinilytica]|uniref:DHA2 family efflux MFS transporter permease subunit n=1 Tax=Andreprevotia chitinilytica TaxID=396808 RepID=UPI00054F96F2|nr:DHA2 family efflux MFS transporter permease subunit [Andreprevotia chitinilytica]